MLDLLTSTILLGAASLLLEPCFCLSAEHDQPDKRATGSLDSYISSESSIALQGVLNNIGPNGTKVPGAALGLVIAGPSKNNPDCT